MKPDETHNGLELLLTAHLFLELSDKYQLKGMSKKYCKMLIKEIERTGNKSFDELYQNDEMFAVNALNKKIETIKILASFNESDAILFEEFAFKFKNNISLARSKGVSFFKKLL
jgi:hypothetical protein